MANIQRNFIKGRMNKSLDERLIPNGEYVDALNVRLGSTEASEIGSVENSKGNTKLSALSFIDGTLLSSEARCIGAIADGAEETIYWFVHDPAFTLGATGKLDLIVSIKPETSLLVYHVVSIDDGGGVNTTLNFNPTYLITGVDLVDDLLFFTDDYNAPRKINVTKNYQNPGIVGATYIDGGGTVALAEILKESLLVIKKPPIAAPTFTTFNTGNQENFMEERFICFGYRYRYADNEYSATSQFSAAAFVPGPFSFDETSKLNAGMENTINSASVVVNSGGPLVVGFDVLFKEDANSTIKVIEKFDKQELGIADDIDFSVTFDNGKIYTILPSYEILRLYDNVPRFAQAQTMMGNRLMYGNYVDGYDLKDVNNNLTKFEYSTELISEPISIVELSNRTDTGLYNIDVFNSVSNSVMYVDLTGVPLEINDLISITLYFEHEEFTGPGTPISTTPNTVVGFSFQLARNYTSVYDLATDVVFIEAVGAAYNIATVPLSCNGATWTDSLNCLIPGNLGAYIENESGIDAPLEPISIIASPSSNEIGFQLVAMKFVDPALVPPNGDVYEYYKITDVNAEYSTNGIPRSLHSNRSYELGIVYMDDFNRSTTALVSSNNSIHIPCGQSSSQNYIKATIPPTQIAPSWATRYKFVIRADRANYETIYSEQYYSVDDSNDVWIFLEGENARKVEEGDRLIVKSDSSGPMANCVTTTVLEKKSLEEGIAGTLAPSGVYMRVNNLNYNLTPNVSSALTYTGYAGPKDNGEPQCLKPFYGIPFGPEFELGPFATETVPGTWVNWEVPAGSVVEVSFSVRRPGTGQTGCSERKFVCNETFISTSNYVNMSDFWVGDNITSRMNAAADTGSQIMYYNLSLIHPSIPCDTEFATFWTSLALPGNPLYFSMKSFKSCGGFFNTGPKIVSASVSISLRTSQSRVIFETEPQDTLPDVFYEADSSYSIDSSGLHSGNIQDQTATLPAIIDTSFFNCYAFGNGAESYKVRDSIIGKTIDLGNRTLTTSAQDFKEADRFADITYSGVYNDESNVNKLNEFNLGLLNFSPLEESFGPIQKMDGRETDVLVLQEDKISYVLSGKNLLSDAAGGGAITSVPEVLGKQIARTEEFGISYNPESYVSWGYDKFFTDSKRGAVLQLRGQGQNEQLTPISQAGMRSWFRDLFNESFATQKLGAFDPYMNEYVLSSNDIALPIEIPCDNCGITRTVTLDATETETYCVYVGFLVGDVDIDYAITGGVDYRITATYNGGSVDTGVVNASGTLTVAKNLVGTTEVSILVEALYPSGTNTIGITTNCPDAEEITIVEVCVSSDSNGGEFIHNEYRWTDGVFVSPLHSSQVTLASGTDNVLISKYSTTTGLQGAGVIPADAATMSLISNKFGFDDYNFDPLNDRFLSLRSNTLYGNTIAEIETLLDLATIITPTGSAPTFQGDFVVPATGQYLYLIWDYRERTPIQLCYSTSADDACCNCVSCEEVCSYYIVSNTSGFPIAYEYADCATGAIVGGTLSATTAVQVCSRIEPYLASKKTGLDVTFLQCGCP